MKKVGKNLLSLLQGQKPEHFCDPSPVRSNVTLNNNKEQIMAKREFWEDIINAIDNISAINNDNSQKYTSKQLPSEGHLASGENPFNKSEKNLDEYFSIALHEKLNEIDWESLNIDLNDDDEWKQEEICLHNYELMDEEKADYNGCKEEFDRISSKIHEVCGGAPLEKCAWYQSYHYLPRTYWGIHILETCLIGYAKKIYRFNGSKTKNDAMKSAFLLLFCHELFHYIVDNAASILEVAKNNPTIYRDYSKNVYAKDFINPGALEEALANRYLYGRFDFCRINKHLLFHILKSSPNGYRDFDQYSGSKFWLGQRKLINQILSCESPARIDLPIEQVFEILNQRVYSSGHRIPIWLHNRKGSISKIIFK